MPMFDNDEEREDFMRMLKECKDKHRAIDEGIRALLTDNGCHHFNMFGNYLIGRNILISEVIDEYGEMHLLSFGSPDLKAWDVSGMLGYVKDKIIQDNE